MSKRLRFWYWAIEKMGQKEYELLLRRSVFLRYILMPIDTLILRYANIKGFQFGRNGWLVGNVFVPDRFFLEISRGKTLTVKKINDGDLLVRDANPLDKELKTKK